MKVLVTGATGFVGTHVVEALRAVGDNVRAIVRPTGDAELVSRLGAEEVVRGELEDAASLERACRGCEVVYHAAARVEIVGEYREFHETTVAGTERLVAAAMRCGVRRFVYVSSCGVYHPRLLKEGTISEATQTPEPPSWFKYGRAKLAAENVVRRQIVPPSEWTIIRLGYLYGPRNRAMDRYLRPLLSRQSMRLLGRGDNELAMLYVTDAARAIVAAGRTPAAAGQTLIAVGSERVTQRDYLNALADGFGVPRAKGSVPYRLAFALAWVSEKLGRWIGGNRQVVLNRSAIALTGLPQRIDGSETSRLLGWTPEVKFADGVREAFAWYQQAFGRRATSVADQTAEAPVRTKLVTEAG